MFADSFRPRADQPWAGNHLGISPNAKYGGGGGIRTPETFAGLTVFKTVPFDRSGTPPYTICEL